ncbi:MAG: C10 family peptidase [Bacteroidales bacterium]|nr:C10 family peptidase [Bacteroidales bacterium]
MKNKLYILLFAVLVSGFASAAPVSRNKAVTKAADFMGVEASRARLAISGRVAISAASSGDPSYYIFNRDEGGFVIIAGDDCLEPVLGYSNTGHVDGDRIPSNMQKWLDRVSHVTSVFRKYNLPQRADIADMWKSGSLKMGAGVSPTTVLELPTWYQEHPYNWYCPMISKYEEDRSMTGCVATALGMVMRYFEWPPCGKGTLPDYSMDFWPDLNSNKTIQIAIRGHELGHEYKWSMMPMTSIANESGNLTEAEKQVAWLLYDLGIMMRATYSYEGTGAYTQDIPEAMNKYMYYKKSTVIYLSNYTKANWISTIKGQIDKGLPVLYGGNSDEGGHQFVVCGYDAADNLYVNWGWDGFCDGFFTVGNFAPYKDEDLSFLLQQGYTQAEINEIRKESYDSDVDAVINLEPDKSTTPVPVAMAEPAQYQVQDSDYPADTTPKSVYLKAGKAGKYSYYGISRNDGTFGKVSKGETMLLNAGLIYNPTSSRYTGYYRFDHYDYKGNYVETIGAPTRSLYIDPSKYYYIYDVSCTVRDDVKLGDVIRLYTSTSTSGEYKLVEWDEGYDTVGEMPMIPMPFISEDGSRIINAGGLIESGYITAYDPGEYFATVNYKDGTVEYLYTPVFYDE